MTANVDDAILWKKYN